MASITTQKSSDPFKHTAKTFLFYSPFNIRGVLFFPAGSKKKKKSSWFSYSKHYITVLNCTFCDLIILCFWGIVHWKTDTFSSENKQNRNDSMARQPSAYLLKETVCTNWCPNRGTVFISKYNFFVVKWIINFRVCKNQHSIPLSMRAGSPQKASIVHLYRW